MTPAPVSRPGPHGLLAYPVTRCSPRTPGVPGYAPCVPGYPNFASYAMYAHRLWTTLWMESGKPADNPARPVGNARVTAPRRPAVHSVLTGLAIAQHSRCARMPTGLAGQTAVIPGIHRPYDDYHFRYQRYLHTKAGCHGSPDHSVAVQP
jgi:hypothetical protein